MIEMFFMKSNQSRQDHVTNLAKGLKCNLVQDHEMPGMMYVEYGYVEGPTITNQIEYITVLHELGHFANGHTQGRPGKEKEVYYFTNGVLRSECEAWNWALDNCSEDIEDSTRKFMWDVCLGSYYHGYLYNKNLGKKQDQLWNGNRHHYKFIWDVPDEYFISTMKRLKGDLPSSEFEVAFLGS